VGEKKGKRKMKKSIFLTVLLGLFLVSTTIADPGDTLWTRTYGGSDYEDGYGVQQTTDGGYVIAGRTSSFGVGSHDFYLVKTDVNGDTLWTRTYGGSDSEGSYSVQQTSDGGYIVTGYTYSFGAGDYDFYLVKTDVNGDTLWTRTYGGGLFDYPWHVQQTSDGGYIIAGETKSFGAGESDAYLVKTDANGDTLWTRTYGGTDYEYGYCVDQTSDGGYIVAGLTESFGVRDVYLVRTDANGDTLWTRTYGGSDYEEARFVQETSDGGYIITGYTSSFGAGNNDFYLVKTDANGDTVWTRTYGGSAEDNGWSVQQTTDGGYIISGYTKSFGAGSRDVYLVKTDADGDTLWTRAYGGSNYDYGKCVQQTTDGGYIVAAYTKCFGAGSYDVWLLRIAGEAPPPDVSIEIVPDNPPVTVPQGGSFGYTGTVTNNTEDPQVTDAWVMAVGPLEGVYGPFRNFQDLQLGPSQARSAHFNQRVPRMAPLGLYNYIAYCGDYPSTAIDSSFFEVEVIAGTSSGGDIGWVLTGSFSKGEFTDLPSEFALLSNYPNPFNASTVISYEVPATAHVKLEVYNLFGQKVATLVEGQQEAGYRSVTWEDSEAASGVYFYKLTAGDFAEVKRMTLLR
jgi:hypothetical protein